MRASALFVLVLSLVPACGGTPSTPADAGRDAPVADALVTPDAFVAPDAFVPVDAFSPLDAATHDGGTDTAVPCGHPVGERFSAGDTCNFCECDASGARTCTDRVCHESIGGCTYQGTMHDYGARFPSADGCNVCVCAASGLACTTRPTCTDVPSSAILLESPDDACGTNPAFTPAHVLATLPTNDFTAPFLYDRGRSSDLYPESLPDTTVHIRLVFDDGFMVCRIPDPSQPALDLQIRIEWTSADGAFDEGFDSYLRRNDFGFLDAWDSVASLPLHGLNGTYVPNCALDPGGYAFNVEVEPSGHAFGAVNRVCETDLSLMIGSFDHPGS